MNLEQQIEQLSAVVEQKQNEVNALTERTQLLGGFQAEALNGREKIAELTQKVEGLEQQVAQATKAASDAASHAASAASSGAASAKKVAAAEDLAKAIKVLLGS